jgi:hypothetical protein
MLTILGLLSMLFVAAFTAYNYRHGTDEVARREALVEAWTQIIIGFAINFCVNLVMIPLMSSGGHVSFAANFWGGWVYTAVALVRQYAIRRWFDKHIAALRQRVLNAWSFYVQQR